MTTATAAQSHKVVSHNEWLRAQTEFLAKEKELTRLSDELTRTRRQLPWEKVEKQYIFTGQRGAVSLAELFDGCSQLATYHFMFGPDWDEGCPGCSYVMDHMNGAVEHLRARDVSLVAVSRGSWEKLAAFRQRMGWRFPWVSSAGNDFNHDFRVSFTADEVASGAKGYNFGTIAPYGDENPGISFFCKDSQGAIFHTYSAYGRGLEGMLGTYTVLDRAPLGRQEEELTPPMSWVRHHDKYQPTAEIKPSCCH